MSDVKPGQIWERRSTPAAPWLRVRVVNVLFDEMELQYMDPPNKVFGTSRTHMLGGGGHGQGAEYRFVSD
jgi:hypothetical protein